MPVTIELVAPAGETLTASLFPLGSDTAAVTDVELAERTHAAGVYRGSFAAGPSGLLRVLVFDAAGELLGVTAVFLTGDEGQVAYCSDDAAVLARIADQVASGPVAVIPAPPTDYQTTVYGTCYDDDGSLKAGVAVTLSIDSAKQAGHGLYTKHDRTDLSDANGLVTFSIPRNPALRFALRVGEGQAVTFQGVDAETLELPIGIG